MLVDPALGNGEMEIRTTTLNSLVRHRITFRGGGDDRVHTKPSYTKLALADVLYFGWLARLLASLEALGMRGPLSALLESGA